MSEEKMNELKERYHELLVEGNTREATKVSNKMQRLEDEGSVSEESVSGASFEELDGVGDELASVLSERFSGFDELAEAGPEDLEPVPGIGEKRAESLVKQAQER